MKLFPEYGWGRPLLGLFLLYFAYVPISLWIYFDVKKWSKKSALWIPAICMLGMIGVYIYLACKICFSLKREREGNGDGSRL